MNGLRDPRLLGAPGLLLLCALVFLQFPARAGGPLAVGGPDFGIAGEPFLWDTSAPIPYRADGGPLARRSDGTVVIDNAAGVARVNATFKVWQDVPTAAISYVNPGSILPAEGFSDGDVDSVEELAAVLGSCSVGDQSPIVFDADGSIFFALFGDSGVIGFAGPCAMDLAQGRIVTGLAVMNGRFQDGINTPTSSPRNFELTAAEFDYAFTHEFGHFSGLDHSQINVNVLSGAPRACSADDLAGLPLMFPILFCQARTGAALLAPDDVAWISYLYPETANDPVNGKVLFASAYGILRGTILFSDGISHLQGANVIARIVDNPATVENEPRRQAVAVVSGFRFTGLPGQEVTGTNPGSLRGSRDARVLGTFEIPVLPGNYRVEVEAIFPGFLGGSRVGPMFEHYPLPGPPEFWNSDESDSDDPSLSTTITVNAGDTVLNINIILNGTPPRFDTFEGPDPPAAARPGDAPRERRASAPSGGKR